jgi:hypothetical protein
MPLPLNKRDFDVFLSHAHVDKAFVVALDHWLREVAGLSVWYDGRELSAGASVAIGLQGAIERCRSVLLVATEESLQRGWVKAEYSSAMDEAMNHPGFRVVALRLRQAPMKDVMKGISWIDVPDGEFNSATAVALLRAFYPSERRPNPSTSRDVFISCTWHPDDGASARAVSSTLIEQGFRLIGDEKDQRGFGSGNRVEAIISSCGAFVGIIPYRGVPVARLSEGPYKYFLRELDFAKSLGLPTVALSDPRVNREDGDTSQWLAIDTTAIACPAAVSETLSRLWEEWLAPPKPHYVFCAMDLESNAARTGSPLRDLIERVTGMPTIVGPDIRENNLQLAIMKKLTDAFLVVADISNDNLNTCIEAGIAIAGGANVELVSAGEPRRPPFMLRALQMAAYRNEVEQIGTIYRIVRPYRRRIINAEL